MGIETHYTHLEVLELESKRISAERDQLENKILSQLQARGIDSSEYCSGKRRIEDTINARARLMEHDVLTESETGQEILRLRNEQDQLLDTVWLATSPVQIRTLWLRFNELVGDQPTELQKQTLIEIPQKSE